MLEPCIRTNINETGKGLLQGNRKKNTLALPQYGCPRPYPADTGGAGPARVARVRRAPAGRQPGYDTRSPCRPAGRPAAASAAPSATGRRCVAQTSSTGCPALRSSPSDAAALCWPETEEVYRWLQRRAVAGQSQKYRGAKYLVMPDNAQLVQTDALRHTVGIALSYEMSRNTAHALFQKS